MSTEEQERGVQFWRWFEENEARVFAFEADREPVFDALADALAVVHADLTFEIGPIQEGKRELVISAGGIGAAFPAVRALAALAPPLARWKVTAFRPRRSPVNDLTIGDISVRAAEVWCVAETDGERIGVTVLIPGYRETPEHTFEQIAFLLLDEAIGEHDVETRLGYIEAAAPTGEMLSHAVPLSNLATIVDGWTKASAEVHRGTPGDGRTGNA